jgi:hypothetical protein
LAIVLSVLLSFFLLAIVLSVLLSFFLTIQRPKEKSTKG